MKYLKLFESNYSAIVPPTNWKDWCVSFPSDLLNKVLDMSDNFYHKKFDRTIDCIGRTTKRRFYGGGDYFISHESDFYIFCMEDDYFLVIYEPVLGEKFYFKCDQLSGLKQCLSYLKSNGIINGL